MNPPQIGRPQPQEYPPYFDRYISLAPWTEPISALTSQQDATLRLIAATDEKLARHRYAPAKWSVAEVLGHVTDVERMLSYWMWCFARNDRSVRPSVDCEAYVTEAGFDQRSLGSLAHEYQSVRQATLAFVATLRPDALSRTGQAGGGALTVRAILYVIGGHELHHLTTLRERYGVSVAGADTQEPVNEVTRPASSIP